MKPALPALVAMLIATPALALDPPPSSQTPLSPQEESAAFRAAGFKEDKGAWKACEDPGTAGYLPGEVSEARDINGDGRLDAVISESSSFCFGAAGMGYYLVSKQADGSWKLLDNGSGVVRFLATKGADGWPDMEVGGPGFCFPVLRWDGKSYALNRQEYEGKPCKG